MSRRGERPKRDDATLEPSHPAGGKGASGRFGRIHDRVLEASAVIDSGVSADHALEQLFRRSRDLGGSERAEVSELVYGLIRGRRRLEDRIQRAAKAVGKSLDLLEPPIRARLVLLALRLEQGATLETIEAIDPYLWKRIPGLFERIHSGRLPEPKRTPAEALAIRWSLPSWLSEALVAEQGPERAAQVAEALSRRAPFTLRANTALCTRQQAIERIKSEHQLEAEPTRFAPDGLILERHAPVSQWPMFEAGWLEVQDEASQLVALATGAGPGEVVLDGCAGAGGKTLALGALMKGGGRITAIDVDPKKLEELKRRGRRAGLSNLETLAIDLGSLPEKLVGRADRVLIDAPCSASGIIRRQPDAIGRLTADALRELTQLQLRLLLRAIDATRPGGVLTYATCSILRAENEAIVEAALAADLRIRPSALADTLGSARLAALGAAPDASAIHLGPGPGEKDGDGFFIALLRRVS